MTRDLTLGDETWHSDYRYEDEGWHPPWTNLNFRGSRASTRHSAPSMDALLNLPSSGGFMRRCLGEEPLSSPSSPIPSDPPRSPSSPSRHRPAVESHDASSWVFRRYVCDHNSAPPAHQYITTDKTNILIRALTLKRSKDELAGRLASGASASGASRGPSARPPAPAVGAARATQGVAPFAAANPPSANTTSAADDARGKRPTSDPLAGLGRQPPSGLERAAKRPALDPSASTASASAPAAGEDVPKLETLSADQLRAFLRARGVTGAAVAIAGKAALLSQARLAAAKPIVHPPGAAR